MLRCRKYAYNTAIILALALSFSGCSTPVLDQARSDYYNNAPQDAIQKLQDAEIPDRDKILFLMERGTIHQLADNYQESQHDYNEADTLMKARDTRSVTRGAGSMLASDNVLKFYGYPFERTYLHVMDALSYLAVNDYQGAGVEARRIINSLKKDEIGHFPADAFSRYLAGLCLELVDDTSNAKVQYRKASLISDNLDISDAGLIVPGGSIDPDKPSTQPQAPPKNTTNIVFIALIGRVADYSSGIPKKSLTTPVITLSANGKELAKASTMADLGFLASKSEAILAIKKAAKTSARVATKAAIVNNVSNENDLLGFALYLLLFSLEQPDFRHWETLPRFINVARFTLPAGVTNIDVSASSAVGAKRPPDIITIPQNRNRLKIIFARYF